MTKSHDYPKGTTVGYLEIIGTQGFRKTYECAAWFKEIQVQPGLYPILTGLEPWEDQWKTGAFVVALPGKVIGSCFDTLWCGNTVSTKRDQSVGEHETYHIVLSGFDLGQALTDQTPWQKITLLPEFSSLIVSLGLFGKYDWDSKESFPDPTHPMLRLELGLSRSPYRTKMESGQISIVMHLDQQVISTHAVGTDLRPVLGDLGVVI